ncbi:hypothetical protein EVAR_102326_1 [Eumeta japonica]|uniref:Uncharacterized protein n=1 Tax=Eumeta variegata TaxID=151549 RepID=A0A4C1ZIZ7_EUMVA|nr:hypothetical protein EVAR_102326_1 [Eumeta japonica]
MAKPKIDRILGTAVSQSVASDKANDSPWAEIAKANIKFSWISSSMKVAHTLRTRVHGSSLGFLSPSPRKEKIEKNNKKYIRRSCTPTATCESSCYNKQV